MKGGARRRDPVLLTLPREAYDVQTAVDGLVDSKNWANPCRLVDRMLDGISTGLFTVEHNRVVYVREVKALARKDPGAFNGWDRGTEDGMRVAGSL